MVKRSVFSLFLCACCIFTSIAYSAKSSRVTLLIDQGIPLYRHRSISKGTVSGTKEKKVQDYGDLYNYLGTGTRTIILTGEKHLFLAGKNHLLDPLFIIKPNGENQAWRVRQGSPFLFYTGTLLAVPGVAMSIITLFTGPILFPSYYWWAAAGTGTVLGYAAFGSATEIKYEEYIRDFKSDTISIKDQRGERSGINQDEERRLYSGYCHLITWR